MNGEQAGLKETFGSVVEISDNEGTAETYCILAELDLNGRRYAILQSDAMREEGDIEVFRVTVGPDGQPELETIADDDEWEQAAEAFDDMQFGSDERP